MPSVVEVSTSVLALSRLAGGAALDLPAPTSFWRMRQTTGASEVDEVGSSTLTSNNNVGTTTGIFGPARLFTAASQQSLTATDTPLLRLNVASSIAGWFKLNTKTAFQLLLIKGIDATHWEYEVWYDQSANTMKLNIYDGATGYTLAFCSNPPTGQWISFCVVWTGTQMKAAYNGGAFVTTAAPFPMVTTGQLYTGSFYSPSGFLDGALDAIGIWKGTALTQAQYNNFHNSGLGREYYSGAWHDAPVSPSSPYGVAPALAWYKADADTFQDSALTTPATADAAVVGGWKDQTGQGNHLLQATAGSRPTLRLAQKNSLPSIRFDGTDDFLKALFTLTSTLHLVMVMRMVTWVANKFMVSGGAGDNFSVYMAIGSPVYRVWSGSTTVQGNGAIAVGTFGIFQIRCAAAGSHLLENANAPVNAGTFNVGATGGLTIGQHPVSGNNSNIEIAELILYNTALTDPEETAVRNALNARWAIF